MSNKLEIDHKEEGKRISIELHENDKGLRAFIRETIDGNELPVRMGFIDFIGEGEHKFMVMRAPIRKKDENGEYVTRPREKDGKFLGSDGKEVDSEEKAAREFVYVAQRDDQNKLVYAQIGTLNVKNTKKDGTKTAVTMINAKLYSDDQALEAERINYKMMSLGKDHPEYAAQAEKLKEYRRSTGEWCNFYINAGADILRNKGFEVRVKE